MTFRRTLFWIHLAAGSVAGVVILVLSFTGVLLAFERQIANWADRAYHSHAPSPAASRLAMGTLLASACSAQPSPPTAIVVRSNPESPVELDFGRDRAVYFDAYTGRELGTGSKGVRDFFAAVESWHRWLAFPDRHRATGRMITGTCNLAFLVLIATGMVLWWPRGWSWQRFKSAVKWRADLPPGRARNWNWHSVTGFWCTAPLLIIVACGVVMSFPWANNLLYRVTGNAPPPPAQASLGIPAQPGRGPRRDQSKGGSTAKGEKSNPRHEALSASLASPTICANGDVAATNLFWRRAEEQVPGWQSITLRRGPAANAQPVFMIDRGSGGRPDLRSQLVLDPGTGAVVRWEPFTSYNAGRRLRMWVRFSHTGEAGGVLGQTAAALAALATVVLVITGLAMAWARARTWFGATAAVNRAGSTAETEPEPVCADSYSSSADKRASDS